MGNHPLFDAIADASSEDAAAFGRLRGAQRLAALREDLDKLRAQAAEGGADAKTLDPQGVLQEHFLRFMIPRIFQEDYAEHRDLICRVTDCNPDSMGGSAYSAALTYQDRVTAVSITAGLLYLHCPRLVVLVRQPDIGRWDTPCGIAAAVSRYGHCKERREDKGVIEVTSATSNHKVHGKHVEDLVVCDADGDTGKPKPVDFSKWPDDAGFVLVVRL